MKKLIAIFLLINICSANVTKGFLGKSSESKEKLNNLVDSYVNKQWGFMDIAYLLNGFLNTSEILLHVPKLVQCALKEAPIEQEIEELKKKIEATSDIEEKLKYMRKYFEEIEPKKKTVEEWCNLYVTPELIEYGDLIKKWWNEPGKAQQLISIALERIDDIIELIKGIIDAIQKGDPMEAGSKIGEIFLIFIGKY